MGRSQQVNIFGTTDPAVSKDFWVQNWRKLVITLAVFLPVFTTYLYFATPGTPTEFFKGRPLASFIPLVGSTNTTATFDSNANRNDTEVEPSSGNTRGSQSTQPGEENVDIEVDLSVEITGNITDSSSTQPAEESDDTELEPNFKNPDNSTESLTSKPGEEISGTELEPDFENTDNHTESLREQTVEKSADTQLESSFQESGNTTDNLTLKPGEEINDTELGPNFENTGNSTESLSTEPVILEPEAAAEEDTQTTDAVSDTLTSTNETIPGLGLPHEELANVTASESLNNFTSPNVNASKQRSPNDNSSNIAMEGQGVVSNETSRGTCNLVRGSWVPDIRPPPYTNATCDLILEAQNCIRNGRPDSGYLHWRWQPEKCDLPRIEPQAFLTAMRNRSMAFVGDSIARNQFQALLCLLAQVERPEITYRNPDEREYAYLFRKQNFTIAVYWSPYLVHVDYKQITLPSNATEIIGDIHLDKLDETLLERIPGVDILQISTGQWWFKFGYYSQNGRRIGCHTYPGMPECEDVGYAKAYITALHTILRGVLSTPGFTGTTLLRSFAPDHFEAGTWETDGHCVRTEPGGVPMSDLTQSMHQVQIQAFQNITASLSASEKQRMRLLDITNLAQERPDGHPNAYRTPHPYSNKTKAGERIQKDCLHWCIPGPIDTWNELLVETLRDKVGYL